VLIIDDIQFLAGKDKTQDVFFHIFNQLHQRSKQLVITSDKPPVDIEGMEPRLLSRFKWGLTADLQLPDLETRIAILQKRLYNDGITMPENVIEFLAYSIISNIRELEGAMISVLAQASLNKKEILQKTTPKLHLHPLVCIVEIKTTPQYFMPVKPFKILSRPTKNLRVMLMISKKR